MALNREKIANNSDVQKMISDVSDVLSKHLISIIGKLREIEKKWKNIFCLYLS